MLARFNTAMRDAILRAICRIKPVDRCDTLENPPEIRVDSIR
jgi:hypothetical protein